jgi:hypothetical protein
MSVDPGSYAPSVLSAGLGLLAGDDEGDGAMDDGGGPLVAPPRRRAATVASYSASSPPQQSQQVHHVQQDLPPVRSGGKSARSAAGRRGLGATSPPLALRHAPYSPPHGGSASIGGLGGGGGSVHETASPSSLPSVWTLGRWGAGQGLGMGGADDDHESPPSPAVVLPPFGLSDPVAAATEAARATPPTTDRARASQGRAAMLAAAAAAAGLSVPASPVVAAAATPYVGSVTFDLDRLTIGTWTRRRVVPGDLTCHLSGQSRELAWELVEAPFRCKIAVPFASVARTDLHISLEAVATWTVRLSAPPLFFLQSTSPDGGRSAWTRTHLPHAAQRGDELGKTGLVLTHTRAHTRSGGGGWEYSVP